MCGTRKCRAITVCVLGLVLLGLGGALIPVIKMVINDEVKKNVVLTNGSMLYDIWKNITIPVYMQFYVFNVTNPDEVKAGATPYLNQKGPYTYREHRFKVDIVHHSNGTVSYRQIRTFHFVPEMSVGDESDNFTTVNGPFVTLLNALRYESSVLQTLIGWILDVTTADVFMTRPVNEILFGYTDPLLEKAKEIDPDWFYSDYAGYFINKNNTDDGEYTIFTGETDISKLGEIDVYNGSRMLDFWTSDSANMINGSDGSVGPPFLEEQDILPAFASDICRSLYGVFSKDVELRGMSLRRFEGTKDELANSTTNAGFCTPEGNCMGSGVLNISTCQTFDYFHIPVVISFPHFYMADKQYIDGVKPAMSPNKEEHETYVDIEPLTGLVLQVAKRLQINLHLRNIPHISQMSKIKTVVLPIFWLNESSVVDDDHVNMLHNKVFLPILLTDVLKYGLIAIGALMFVCGGITTLCIIQADERHPTRSGEGRPLLKDQTASPVQDGMASSQGSMNS